MCVQSRAAVERKDGHSDGPNTTPLCHIRCVVDEERCHRCFVHSELAFSGFFVLIWREKTLCRQPLSRVRGIGALMIMAGVFVVVVVVICDETVGRWGGSGTCGGKSGTHLNIRRDRKEFVDGVFLLLLLFLLTLLFFSYFLMCVCK